MQTSVSWCLVACCCSQHVQFTCITSLTEALRKLHLGCRSNLYGLLKVSLISAGVWVKLSSPLDAQHLSEGVLIAMTDLKVIPGIPVWPVGRKKHNIIYHPGRLPHKSHGYIRQTAALETRVAAATSSHHHAGTAIHHCCAEDSITEVYC